MSEAPLANSAEARTSTGEIKDVSTTATETTPLSTTPEPKEGETVLIAGDKTTEATVVPDKYEFTLPEGVKFEGEQLESATKLFKEQGLSQAQAQSLVDYHVTQLRSVAESATKAYDDLRADWQAKALADPEIGPKLAQIKENVGRVYAAIGDAKLVGEFREAMNLTGIGDNPVFIKVMNKLSEFVAEGRHVSGQGPSPHGQSPSGRQEKPSVASAMYPNLPASGR